MKYESVEMFLGAMPLLKGLPVEVTEKAWMIFESIHKVNPVQVAREAIEKMIASAYQLTPHGWTKISLNAREHNGMIISTGAPMSSETPAWVIDEATGIARKSIVFTREGVANKKLKTAEEIQKSRDSFQFSPMTIGHPPQSEQIWDLVNAPWLGWTEEVSYIEDGIPRLTATAVVDLESPLVPEDVKQQIRDNTYPTGVSAGYYRTILQQPGAHSGSAGGMYDYVESNIRGQHIATAVPTPALTPAQGVAMGLNQTPQGDYKMAEETAKMIKELTERATKAEQDLEAERSKVSKFEEDMEKLTEKVNTLTEGQSELEDLKNEKAEAEKARLEAKVKTVTDALGGDPASYDGVPESTLDEMITGLIEKKLVTPKADPAGLGPAGSEPTSPPGGQQTDVGDGIMPPNVNTVGDLSGETQPTTTEPKK